MPGTDGNRQSHDTVMALSSPSPNWGSLHLKESEDFAERMSNTSVSPNYTISFHGTSTWKFMNSCSKSRRQRPSTNGLQIPISLEARGKEKNRKRSREKSKITHLQMEKEKSEVWEREREGLGGGLKDVL